MNTSSDKAIFYRERRIDIAESRPGVLKCEWGSRNQGPEHPWHSAGTVKVKDFENEAAARQFLIRRAKKQIDAADNADAASS